MHLKNVHGRTIKKSFPRIPSHGCEILHPTRWRASKTERHEMVTEEISNIPARTFLQSPGRRSSFLIQALILLNFEARRCYREGALFGNLINQVSYTLYPVSRSVLDTRYSVKECLRRSLDSVKKYLLHPPNLINKSALPSP